MRSIKQLMSYKVDNEEFRFKGEIADIKDAWGLMIPTYRSKEHEEKGIFMMEVMPNVVGTVVQYNDGRYECNLNSIDFQGEYKEDELKQIIIDDIKFEILSEAFGNNIKIAENISKITQFYKAGIKEIKKIYNDLVNLI